MGIASGNTVTGTYLRLKLDNLIGQQRGIGWYGGYGGKGVVLSSSPSFHALCLFSMRKSHKRSQSRGKSERKNLNWMPWLGRRRIEGDGCKRGVESRRQGAGSSPRTGAGCGRCWLKPAGLKLLLTSNQSKATYWLNKFNWQQQQWNERRAQAAEGVARSWQELRRSRGRGIGRQKGRRARASDSSSNDNDTLMQV